MACLPAPSPSGTACGQDFTGEAGRTCFRTTTSGRAPRQLRPAKAHCPIQTITRCAVCCNKSTEYSRGHCQTQSHSLKTQLPTLLCSRTGSEAFQPHRPRRCIMGGSTKSPTRGSSKKSVESRNSTNASRKLACSSFSRNAHPQYQKHRRVSWIRSV